jgi:hypothetical protein
MPSKNCPSCGQVGLDVTSVHDSGSHYICVNLDCPRDKGVEWYERHEPYYDPEGTRKQSPRR